MADIANLIVTDITDKVRSIAHFTNRTFYVWNEDEFLQNAQNRELPIAGVLYAGLRKVESEKRLLCDGVVSLVFVTDAKKYGAPIDENQNPIQATQTLDEVRRVIQDTRAPTGHKWRFNGENIVSYNSGIAIYEQEWLTRVVITTSTPNPV